MLILLAGIGAILLVIWGIVLMRRSEGDPLAVRIDEYASREEVTSMEEIELSLPFTDRVVVPTLRRFSKTIVRFTPNSTIERTAKQLELAGSPRNLSAAEFWGIRILVTLLFAGLTFVMMARFNQPLNKQVTYTLGGFVIGFMLPQMWLKSKIDRRKQAIIKKFPDALDLMTICVDAGLTFDGAMAQVGEKWDDPLSQEFARVVNELQLGKTRRQALRDLSDRTNVSDVQSFIASVLQADQLGVSIGKVLRIQSEQMRIRRRQRAEELAQQAPVKMTFPLVFLIFPSILLVLLGPALFQVLRNNALQGITG
jgi:tight adherence protein C